MRRIFVGEGTKLFAVGKKISYSYDNNGNTVQDGLKGLQISYNILNLPQTVTQSGTTMVYITISRLTKLLGTIKNMKR